MSKIAEVIRPLHWYSNLTLSYYGLSDALGLSDIENLSTLLISSPPHHHHPHRVFKIKNVANLHWLRVSPCWS